MTRLALRLALVATLALALIAAAVPQSIAGAGWDVWLIGGLLAWALERLLDTIINGNPPH